MIPIDKKPLSKMEIIDFWGYNDAADEEPCTLEKGIKKMNKEEYLYWVDNRGDMNTWDLGTCMKVDIFFKKETLEILKEKLRVGKLNSIFPGVEELILDYVSKYFYSLKIKDFIKANGCYPDFIKTDESGRPDFIARFDLL